MFLINQTTIRGRTRLQKYGFLACQLYRADLKPLKFYSDWEAYHYGPYSMDLTRDLQKAERLKLIKIEPREIGGRTTELYSLSPKGAKRLSSLLLDHGALANRIYETFTNLNRKSLNTIVEEIYTDYPQYAENSRIKDRAAGNKLDETRFSPEIERMIQEIEAGNDDWKTHTVEEHIQYVRRLAGD